MQHPKMKNPYGFMYRLMPDGSFQYWNEHLNVWQNDEAGPATISDTLLSYEDTWCEPTKSPYTELIKHLQYAIDWIEGL